MRRLIAFLLISLMAFQTSWAAVTSYCQHEQGVAARHLGHHEHKHHHPTSATASETETQLTANSAGVDLDCSFCHAACIVALLLDSGLAVASQATLDLNDMLALHPPSAPNDLPERPNWS